MHYKRLLTWIDGSSSYLSVGLDVGADFTWMSIALPNVLWSSIFVTLVAKKYHESVTLPSGLRMVYDNH